MEARIVQSLLARNRKEIRSSEWLAEQYKDFCKIYQDSESVDSWWTSVKRHKKQVAKLVEIQKVLKEELRKAYNKEAEQRFYDSM